MVQIGYTMLGEHSGPRALVEDLVRAEEAGFDFSVASDHSFPWLDEQGHSPYVWSVLGAAAEATERVPMMTYVTCPTMRYHPAVVAQKAATVQLLSGGRFRLGLGAGENLNEHVIGGGWPPAAIRQDMLSEAVDIIKEMFEGGYVNHRGRHFQVESAGPAGIAAANQFVDPQDIAASIPCGDDVEEFADSVRTYTDAGFTEVALIQIGGDHQRPFLDWSEDQLLPALRELLP